MMSAATVSAVLLAAGLTMSAALPSSHLVESSGVIDGVVSDSGLRPLDDATITILGSSIRVTTGANGRFRMTALPPGNYILVTRRLGYAPALVTLEVAEQDTVRASIMLARATATLDTVRVSQSALPERLSEFDARRKRGFGQFLGEADIEKRNAVFVSDLLRPILSVGIVEGALGIQRALNTRLGCLFEIFVDGVRLPQPVNLNDLPAPSILAGVEIYSGPATIPLQYKTTGGGGFCGVMLFWTKSG